MGDSYQSSPIIWCEWWEDNWGSSVGSWKMFHLSFQRLSSLSIWKVWNKEIRCGKRSQHVCRWSSEHDFHNWSVSSAASASCRASLAAAGSLLCPWRSGLGLLVVSSTEAVPLEQFLKLSQEQHRIQHSGDYTHPKWFIPNTLKYYILLHDMSDGDEQRYTRCITNMMLFKLSIKCTG